MKNIRHYISYDYLLGVAYVFCFVVFANLFFQHVPKGIFLLVTLPTALLASFAFDIFAYIGKGFYITKGGLRILIMCFYIYITLSISFFI